MIVGSQLSGQVVEILADYNSQVKADQVVARLNSDQIRAKLDAARADLEQMRANRLVQQGMIEKVKAETEKARATQADVEAQVARNEALLADSEKNFQRQSELRARGFSAEQTFDTARTTRDAQAAALNSARAQVNSAKAAILGLAADLQVANANLTAVTAQIAQREALVRQIEVDIRNSEIKSPVDGVVVQRNVELGQTVASSLQSPTLFLIADDLRRMEIAANIDETDVGRIKPGQRVTFTVTAYPGRTFEGSVKQVRLGSTTVAECRDLHNDRVDRESAARTPARHDREFADRNRSPRECRAHPQCRLALASAVDRAGSDACVRARSGATARRGGNGAMRITEFVEAVKTELNLNAAQTKDVDAAIADMRKSFAGSAGGEADHRRAANAAAPRGRTWKTASRLCSMPSQRTKFDEIKKRLTEQGGGRASQIGRVFVTGKDGKPQGTTVRIGATDGAMTEIVSGLEAGRDVIIGGGPKADAATRGPRFGF